MKKAKLFFSTLFVLLTVSLSAQNMRVSGTVKDSATGEGVPFASIALRGTMTGTYTDAEGAYSINVPSNGTLEFTAVGYVTVVEQVNGRGTIDVSLDPDTENLDESIVVAYGTAKKSSFTGSAGTVKSESLQKRTVANVSKALEGMVAGITTTAGSGQPGGQGGIHGAPAGNDDAGAGLEGCRHVARAVLGGARNGDKDCARHHAPGVRRHGHACADLGHYLFVREAHPLALSLFFLSFPTATKRIPAFWRPCRPHPSRGCPAADSA